MVLTRIQRRIQEAYTGLFPFYGYNDASVAIAVVYRGEIPRRIPASDYFTHETWNLCRRCWVKDPLARPSSLAIMEFLLGLMPKFTAESIASVSDPAVPIPHATSFAGSNPDENERLGGAD